MKITPQDMDDVRAVLGELPTRGSHQNSRDLALALIMVRIYDCGYEQALKDREYVEREQFNNKCPYTQAHTHDWCGYEECKGN